VTCHRHARNDQRGRGEGVPYPRYGETVEDAMARLRALPEGITRLALQDAMPPGAARNALDCALWDLEAKASRPRRLAIGWSGCASSQ
jgi:L-alanine-DL-glutamate epimerase-like enolase superfamily enzyme